MAFVETDPAATGTNYERVFAARPEVYEAWNRLIAAVKVPINERRYELATLAAARRLRSSYCSLAHGRVLAERFYQPAEVVAIVHDRAGLDELDAAVMAFAEKIVDDASSVTQADVDSLRALGLSDGEIVDVVLTVAARCFFSTTLDALGIEPDAAYRELDADLREALTVGRPIAEH